MAEMHHVKLPGELEWREVVDQEARERIEELENAWSQGKVNLQVMY